MNVPCKDCKDRYLGCHTKCSRYLKFKVAMAKADKERKAETESFVAFKSYKKEKFKD